MSHEEESGSRPLAIAVIGGGPTATYALERLVAEVLRAPQTVQLEVHVFEATGEFGAGRVHSARQPRTSYLNRITGQVAFAADASMTGAQGIRPPSERPTLHEWCRQRFHATGSPDFDLQPHDWPRRYVHGLALNERFATYVEELRAAGSTVVLHATEVVDVVEAHTDPRLRVCTRDEHYCVDRVLFATGHPTNDPDLDPSLRPLSDFGRRHQNTFQFVPEPYPLAQLDGVASGQRLGVWGTGLTAIDVLLHLTEGRGGAFERALDGRLRYVPSGREPSLVAFSDSGVFTSARPFNDKQRDLELLEHEGRFLTDANVDLVRATRGVPAPAASVAAGNRPRQIDFEKDLLPLVVLEASYVYYGVLLGPEFARRLTAEVEERLRLFLQAAEPSARAGEPPWRWLLVPVEQLVDASEVLLDDWLCRPLTEERLEDAAPDVREMLVHLTRACRKSLPVGSASIQLPSLREQRFDWQRFVDPVPPAAGSTDEDRREQLLEHMRADDADAAQGNLRNPTKAAADGVWRDLRPVIGRAVDFGGLTALSHQRFLRVYLRQHNHLANGAAREVMEKIMALVDSRVVHASSGPRPRLELDEQAGRVVVRGTAVRSEQVLDAVVAARVPAFDPLVARQPLYRNLVEKGMVRRWSNSSSGGDTFAPGGLHLDAELHPVRQDGTSDDRLTFLGPPSEGALFFQLGALRPDQDHHVMRDILVWVASLGLHVNRRAVLAHSGCA